MVIILFASWFALILIFMGAGLSFDAALPLSCLAFIIGVVLYAVILGKRMNALAEVLSKAIEYNPNDINSRNTITLLNRSPAISKRLKIRKRQHYYTTYHPANYTYVGTTSGSTTVGSVVKSGDYTTIDSFDTRKFQLEFEPMGVDKVVILEKIILKGNKLVQEAKKDPVVSKFLNGNTIILRHNDTKDMFSSDAVSFAYNSGNIETAMHMSTYNQDNSSLTKQECTAILNWLCNGNNSSK